MSELHKPFEDGDDPSRSCECEILKDDYQPVILSVTIPIICAYLFLIAVGVGNLIRFYRVQ